MAVFASTSWFFRSMAMIIMRFSVASRLLSFNEYLYILASVVDTVPGTALAGIKYVVLPV